MRNATVYIIVALCTNVFQGRWKRGAGGQFASQDIARIEKRTAEAFKENLLFSPPPLCVEIGFYVDIS